MTKDTTEIEVEVVEVDGHPVVAQPPVEEAPQPQADWQDWRQWQGKVRRMDSRWWPLWVVLGIIALTLIATVGIAAGAIILVVRSIVRFLRALLR